MGIAVDFSFARPTIAELQAAEVEIVIRYLTGQGKAISIAELEEYRAAGIAVCFVFEVGPNDVAGGFAAGSAHATQAKAAVTALGVGPCPIYFAVDESIVPADAVPYFQGINTVLPASLVGDYGEGALCELLEADGLATYHWQSESTSFPGNTATLPITALQQAFNSSPIPNTDRDVICKPDVGQWPRPTSTSTLPGGASMSDFPGAVGACLTADGNGAWVVTNNGNVYTSGDAAEFGTLTTVGVKGVTNIVGIAKSKDGAGYYLWGSDGGVFAFGDAKEVGSYPGLPASEREGERSFGAGSFELLADGSGYVLVALDGNRYKFGS